MFIGVAILQQFRDQLLTHDFNQAMLFFSELPSVNVELCITQAIQAVKITPPSLLIHLQDVLMGHGVSPMDIDAAKRFSFLNNKKGIIGGVSVLDFIEMQPYCAVFDTRPAALFDGGHIPGSIHIDAQATTQISFGMKMVIDRMKFVVVVVQAGEEVETNRFGMVLVEEKCERVALLVVGGDGSEVMAKCGVCRCDARVVQGMRKCKKSE